MRRLISRLKSLLLVPISVGALFLISLGADIALPIFVTIPPWAKGFQPLYGSNWIEHVKSCDFEGVAHINALGMRGPDVSIDKGKKYRIAVIGSSYVYGWGVNDEECWVRLLENNLRKAGVDAEALNLGRNGANVAQYRSLAIEAIPVLKPDLVIVTLGQGCDVCWTGPVPDSESTRLLLKRLYPNFTALLKGPRITVPATPLNEQPIPPLNPNGNESARNQAKSMYDGFSPEEKQHFDRLDQRVKDVFFAGEVNPGVVFLAIKSPEMYTKPLDMNNEATRRSVEFLGQYLGDIKAVARKQGAGLMILSMPFAAYVNKPGYENYRRDGFAGVDGMPTWSDIDAPFRKACADADLPLVTVTDEFRKRGDDADLFFKFDLHLAKEGQVLFADLVTPHVLKQIRNTPRGGA